MEPNRLSNKEKVEAYHLLEDMVKRLDTEVGRIQEAVKEEAVARAEMQRAAESLKAAKSREKVLEALENMQLNIDTMEKWIHSSNKNFPDKDLFTCCQKLQDQFNVWVPDQPSSEGKEGASPGDGQCRGETSSDGKCPSSSSSAAPQENEKTAFCGNSSEHSEEASQAQCDSENITTLSLKSGDLQESRLQVRQLLKKGQVYVVQENKVTGKKLYARISVDEKERMLLHCLRDEKIVPKGSATVLKHEDVVCLVGTTNRKAFLDFGLQGTFIGRVIFSVINKGKYTENFLWLCTGQKEGYSYMQSRIIDECRWHYNNKVTYIALGGFEWEDKFEFGAVVSGVDWNQERKKAMYERLDGKKGVLFVEHICVRKNVSAVNINLTDVYHPDSPRFGQVEEGFQIIKNMFPSNRTHMGEAVIIDCGVIIS